MQNKKTWDDRYPILNHPYLHYGLRIVDTAYKAGVDGGETALAVDTSSGDLTVTLPLAENHPGLVFTIKNVGTGGATVARTGNPDKIDGADSVPLASQYDWVTVVSDGVANWYIVSKNP